MTETTLARHLADINRRFKDDRKGALHWLETDLIQLRNIRFSLRTADVIAQTDKQIEAASNLLEAFKAETAELEKGASLYEKAKPSFSYGVDVNRAALRSQYQDGSNRRFGWSFDYIDAETGKRYHGTVTQYRDRSIDTTLNSAGGRYIPENHLMHIRQHAKTLYCELFGLAPYIKLGREGTFVRQIVTPDATPVQLKAASLYAAYKMHANKDHGATAHADYTNMALTDMAWGYDCKYARYLEEAKQQLDIEASAAALKTGFAALAELANIEGVTVVGMDDIAELHNAIAKAVGEPQSIIPGSVTMEIIETPDPVSPIFFANWAEAIDCWHASEVWDGLADGSVFIADMSSMETRNSPVAKAHFERLKADRDGFVIGAPDGTETPAPEQWDRENESDARDLQRLSQLFAPVITDERLPGVIAYLKDLYGGPAEMQIRKRIRHVMKAHGMLDGVIEADLTFAVMDATEPYRDALRVLANTDATSNGAARIRDIAKTALSKVEK